MKRFLIILAVISSSFIWSSCGTHKGLKFRNVDRLSIQKDKERPFVVYVELYNPNHAPVRIKYATLATYLQDQPLGEVKLDTVIKVRGRHTFRLPLVYNPDYKEMFADPAKVLAMPNLDIKVDGTIDVAHKRKFHVTNIHFQGNIAQEGMNTAVRRR